MTTERDPRTRAVLSWLREDAHENAERVLLLALDEVETTPQRRSWGPARRFNSMNTYAKLIAAAAAVLVVAVVGYRFLPGNGGIGGQPTIAPSPTPSLLARGTFVVHGFSTTLDASGAGSSVDGTMRIQDTTSSQAYTVDLQCERTVAGLRLIAGDVTESNYALAPKGTRAAIILKPGTPVKALYFWQSTDPDAASCQAFFDSMLATGEDLNAGLEPIAGTLALAP